MECEYFRVVCNEEINKGQEIDENGLPIKKNKLVKLVNDEVANSTLYLPSKQLAVNKFGQRLVEGLIK